MSLKRVKIVNLQTDYNQLIQSVSYNLISSHLK